MNVNKEIPAYTRIGIRVTAVLMLVIMFFLLKNCARSVYYGAQTSQEEISKYYEQGLEEGLSAKNDNRPGMVFDHENPLLKKSYQKGFRDGWDGVKTE